MNNSQFKPEIYLSNEQHKDSSKLAYMQLKELYFADHFKRFPMYAGTDNNFAGSIFNENEIELID